MIDPQVMAADLMAAALANAGAWTAHHCPDANTAQAVREICRRDERLETRAYQDSYPNTVAIRKKKL